MRFGSLFSGIGGLDLGLERAGMTCAWQVEIDPYATKVLEKHWPNVPRHRDIRDFYPNVLARRVDLIAGGFPCQDISVAGKGAGLAGARSGLWREYRRILGEVAPPWVLIENVPALRTRGLRIVLSDLHALGYDAEWDGVSASAVGAPHRRDRIFVVAYTRSKSLRLEQGRVSGTHGAGAPESGRDGQPGNVADTTRNRRAQPGRRVFETRWSDADGSGWWAVEPDVGRVASGVSSRVDRLRCLGNAVVPQVAERVGRMILEAAR